jgi:hypothetical protein
LSVHWVKLLQDGVPAVGVREQNSETSDLIKGGKMFRTSERIVYYLLKKVSAPGVLKLLHTWGHVRSFLSIHEPQSYICGR